MDTEVPCKELCLETTQQEADSYIQLEERLADSEQMEWSCFHASAHSNHAAAIQEFHCLREHSRARKKERMPQRSQCWSCWSLVNRNNESTGRVQAVKTQIQPPKVNTRKRGIRLSIFDTHSLNRLASDAPKVS